MITIYHPTRTSTGYKHIGFTRIDVAQAWVDRQVSGGDDGDWTVRSDDIFESLDELDHYLQYGDLIGFKGGK